MEKSLGEFGTGYSIKIRARPLGSESTYRRFVRLPTNGVHILATGIKLHFCGI